jgi:hypothetical protein
MEPEQAVFTIHFSDAATDEQKAEIIAALETLIRELTPLPTASDPAAR